jgi:hypothetical protein
VSFYPNQTPSYTNQYIKFNVKLFADGRAAPFVSSWVNWKQIGTFYEQMIHVDAAKWTLEALYSSLDTWLKWISAQQ